MSLDLITHHPASRQPFAALLSVTEDAFASAGNSLAESLPNLHSLKAMFQSLDAHIGAAANELLIERVADLSTREARLRSDFGAFGEQTQSLLSVIQGMRAEVSDLNTIIRLITNISINARIQGNSLSRPRPQINAFVETLSALAGDAEAILAQINTAMADALVALKRIEGAHLALASDLKRSTFPAIARFTETAQAISAEQDSLRETSTTIDAQMQRVSADVARLVTSLQIGDTLRQRLEQVHAALELTEGRPGTQGTALRLATLLAQGATTEALPMIGEALESLQALSSRGVEIAQVANSSAFADGALRRAGNGPDPLDGLARGFAVSKAHFEIMQTCGQTTRTKLDFILGRERDLHAIALQLRMASINAVITCAKLGDEGRAMRELAQWLRSITDDFYATIERLQSALRVVGDTTREMSETLIGGFDADMQAFQEVASGLGQAIDTARKVLLSTSEQFDRAAIQLADHLVSAGERLTDVRSRIVGSGKAIHWLTSLANLYPAPDGPSAELDEYLAAIRRKYTMASERTIHDALVAELGLGDEASAPVAPPAAPAAVAEDDLDDILF